MSEHAPAALRRRTHGAGERLAEHDVGAARRVCAELSRRNADVCREGARNQLHSARKIGRGHHSARR